jgi:zinc protease
VSWDSLKGDTDQVLAMALDLLFHPKFDEQKLQLAKQQEATGIVRRNDDEAQIAEREGAKLVYGADSPYARQPELSTIRAITLADLQAWHDRTVGGGGSGGYRLIVSVGGDFDSAAMEAKLRAGFEALPPAKQRPVRHDEFHAPKKALYFVNKEDVNQSNVQIVGLGTTRHNPDVPAIEVMNDILGGGFASRLFQTVRTKLGLAYAVGGGLGAAYDHPASFDVEVLTQSATTVKATQAALDVIAGLNATPFTEDEVKRAKDDILNSFLFHYDTKEKVLGEQVRLEFYGYPPDFLETYEAGIKKVTAADVTAAAKKYVHPDQLAVLVVGNTSEIKPPLDELNLGPAHAVDITIPGAPTGGPQGGENQQ